MTKRNGIWILLLPLVFSLGSCSENQDRTKIVYDTAFHLLYVGNMERNEGSAPEGYIDYSQYFKSSSFAFRLDQTFTYSLTQYGKDNSLVEEVDSGTYEASKPTAGSTFKISFVSGRKSILTWMPNWHDPLSTPYEAYEKRTIVLLATGETLELTFTYVNLYTSEM